MVDVVPDPSSVHVADSEGPQPSKKKEKKKPVKKEVKPTRDELKEKKVSKQLAKIKEEVARRRAEEERLLKKAEEEERRLEEERKKQEEIEARERELRERKKQKEKERKQRLKEEGKLMSDKQKEDRRKIIELMHSRGIDVPDGKAEAERKPPQYTKPKKRNTQTKKADTNGDALPEVPEKVEEVADEPLTSWELLASALDDITEADQFDKDSDSKITLDTACLQEPMRSEAAEPFSHSEVVLSEEEKERLIDAAKKRVKERHEQCEANRSEQILRAGVICVLGHVDTGKTKILDKLRNTNVQDREAGGITQQIGATNVPLVNIKTSTKMCPFFRVDQLRVPGLLIIDTPGHESFSNLRVRGSSLCDLAILVVDLMHGLEEQTKESIRILRSRKTPFIVALNKIDRLYGWKSNPNVDVQTTLESQEVMTRNDFDDHFKQVVQDFAMMNINVKLFYDNPNPDEFISMVPTSAHTGDGMGDLLAALCMRLQDKLSKRLAFSEELHASVMEVLLRPAADARLSEIFSLSACAPADGSDVGIKDAFLLESGLVSFGRHMVKELHGLGTTIDVIIVNGRIREGDTIVLAGQEGPIATQVRGLLQPAPMSELRVKGTYQHMKEIQGAQGVKLIAKDLEKALAGLPLYVATDLGEELFYKEEVCRGLTDALKAISVAPLGVYVVASTLGSLESLLVYLKSVDIPYSGISIGTVHKKDVMKSSVMVEREPKWAVILAFDVKVDKDAQKLAAELKVKIFTSEIIYRLQTQMEEYIDDLKRGNRQKHRDLAVYPCKLRILPDMIFNKRAPIVVGVHVEAGVVRERTPLCVPSKDCIHLGRVYSIESNHKPVEEARTGQEVCIRIDPLDGETPKLYGRHFDHNDLLVSKISRESIDVMKEHFRSDLNKEDWRLMVELKKLLDIF
ncbi:translation initiation factor 5B [Paragonimus westermani]|uniref:Eukaryotic translation initiation factor 5B n=1 Tax=Paragonimus westermani TaxID=34504 RepID=A0A5J4NV21_9TREM|nr:translation initiation factor 5B [Paragonimus westermani]